MALMFLMLSALAVSQVYAQDEIRMPAVQGWLMSTARFASAETLGQVYCETDYISYSEGWKFDHIEYAQLQSSDIKPAIFVWCRKDTPTGPRYLKSGNSAFPYSATCIKGPLFFDTVTREPYCSIFIPPPPCQLCRYGNPIDVGANEKIQSDVDISESSRLGFTRYFSSVSASGHGMEAIGIGWRHNFSKRLYGMGNLPQFHKSRFEKGIGEPWQVSGSNIFGSQHTSPLSVFVNLSAFGMYPRIVFDAELTRRSMYATRPDGYFFYFESKDNGVHWATDSISKYKLRASRLDLNDKPNEFELLTPSDDVEVYDGQGFLREVRYVDGYRQIFSYQGGLLSKVEDSFGRSLTFSYNEYKEMVRVADPAGNVYAYEYDNDGVLIRVIYPDGLSRRYGYTGIQFLLTEIELETTPGVFSQYAKFGYDFAGRPVSTEHAGEVERYVIDPARNTVVTPLGSTILHEFVTINGARYMSRTREIGGGDLPTLWDEKTYDANGNILWRKNRNGVWTQFSYDLLRSLETSRTEASGFPEAKKTTTQWHSNFRLPVQINEPLLRTNYVYDATGNVLMKTIQATTDVNGSQGAAATTVGTQRIWSYTYNAVGQVLTSTGPRSDVFDQTVYTYDNQGNLTTVTNPAGHVTNLSNYDPHGHVGTIVDPNGVTTNLSYHVRGWLLSRTVVADGISEATNYSYDGVGQMTQVTLPDNSQIHYTYDAAHRLTAVSDSLGNSINYTLDNMGNRLKEEVKDASGNLSRQVTRVYDALNRLQQVTGGMQ